MSWSRIFDRPTGDGSPIPPDAPWRLRTKAHSGVGPGLTREELRAEVEKLKTEMEGHVTPERSQVDDACAVAIAFANRMGWEADALLYVEMRGRADQSGGPTNGDGFGVYVERRGLATDPEPQLQEPKILDMKLFDGAR